MSPLEELGKDAKSVAALQRKHTAFEHDLQMLAQQVNFAAVFLFDHPIDHGTTAPNVDSYTTAHPKQANSNFLQAIVAPN